MRALLAAVVCALCACASPERARDEQAGPGRPFGATTKEAYDELFSFAKSKGPDLDGLMRRVYADGDQKALTDAFEFGATLRAPDANARAYGNLIYSAFLDLMETRPEVFTQALLAASPAARQRIRDLVYYPLHKVKPSERADADAEAPKDFPLIFPADYRYGADGALFP